MAVACFEISSRRFYWGESRKISSRIPGQPGYLDKLYLVTTEIYYYYYYYYYYVVVVVK